MEIEIPERLWNSALKGAARLWLERYGEGGEAMPNLDHVPREPVAGRKCFDTTRGRFFLYNGTGWEPVPDGSESSPVALEYELQVYRAHRARLLGAGDVHAGKYAVVRGDDVSGPWDTYEDALRFGYGRHGLVPFLVKKIERVDRVESFTRPI
jgi:hypothetical protein